MAAQMAGAIPGFYSFVCYLTPLADMRDKGGAMRNDREHPLYYLDAETLLVATYVWVDDTPKALQSEGIRLPKPQRHQKATLSELLTIALFLTFLGLDLSKGYLLAQSLLRSYFPSLT